MSDQPMTPPSATAEAGSARLRSKPGFWNQRLGLEALSYPIPDAATKIRYGLGFITLFSFVVLVLTGVWLAQFYNPTPAGAHPSVLYIITRAPFGDIARSLHYWAASAMVVSLVAHIAWGFYSRAYRAPREITWYAGLAMAALVFLLVVTGTILRYDQEGFEALAHLRAGAALVGPLGSFFASDFTLSVPLLSRMFVLHVALLPLGILALLGIHLWLVRVLGISAEGPERSSFSENLRRLMGVSLLLFAGLVGLSVVFPEGLGHPAIAGFEITKPFWPLLWIYALESATGMWALIWAPVAVFAFLAAVPLLDRGSAGGAGVLWLRVAGGVLLMALIALAVWAAITPPQQHLGM